MVDDGDRRGQILAAAFREFAEKGFRGATIKSIAEAAKLQAPALIYWYFPNGKEDLFQAVLERHVPILRAVTAAEGLMERPPEEVLPLLARAYMGTLDHPLAPRLVRLLVGEGLRRPEIGALFVERGPARVLAFLKEYLSRQIQLHRLRPHDTRAAARAFIGMLIPQIAAGVAFPTLGADGLTNEEHLRESVAIFLRGLAPESGQPAAGDDQQGTAPDASCPRDELLADG